ncbi:MAG TPA: SprT-like domain-containing protein [Gemmatimonadales bacterium]|nr:SprT-like domain-containing protein [Gemmatimonadales bacterium]
MARTYARFNREHFGGQLREIPFRLSARMRTRLGQLSVNLKTGEVNEIAISRKHLRNGWAEVEKTVLHEMVHQWQVENHLPLDHGPGFRRKAREVGIAPRARRKVVGDVIFPVKPLPLSRP